MDATGVVKELRGPKALVSVRRQTACEGCAAGSSCIGAVHGAELEAHNYAEAQPGDMVRISFKPMTYLKGSLLVYGIPALALIIGAIVGKEFLAGYWTAVEADLVSALTAFGLFGVTVICMRFLIKRLENSGDLEPVIEEVLKRDQTQGYGS
jgi:sigma-E factor negative regulatory protein RseC